jgi:hypothetical protein
LLQLPTCHDYCVEQLLYLWISCLSVFQDLADEVYWLSFCFCLGIRSLNDDDYPDDYIGGKNIE